MVDMVVHRHDLKSHRGAPVRAFSPTRPQWPPDFPLFAHERPSFGPCGSCKSGVPHGFVRCADRALSRAASEDHRSVARAHPAAAGAARPSGAAPAAGDPCGGHQRQGLDDRLHAGDSRERRARRSRLYVAASCALPRAHPARPAQGRTLRQRGAARGSVPPLRGGEWRASRSPCSRSPPRPRFLLFAEEPADVLLLEVGLGGRFDATNIVDHRPLRWSPSIGHDHAEYLGTTLEGIAREKAGIFKRGCPAVIAPQDYLRGRPDPARAEAERIGASPIIVGAQDFSVHEEGGRLVYQDEEGLARPP